MEKASIRPAMASDYLAIHTLNKESMGYEFDISKTKSNLEHILSLPYYKIFVAETNNEVVGYIHASNYDNTYSKPLKNIMGIAVSLTLQQQGIGRLLLHAIEQWAKDDTCCGVRLVSGLNREKAHIFYEHCGYARRKEQINFIKWF